MTTKPLLKDMVVILPGILGSVLQKDGQPLWEVSGKAVWNLITDSKNTLRSLELGPDDPTVDDLGDGIRATGLIEDVHIVPGLVKIDGYNQTTRMITDHFQVTLGDIYNDPEDKAANLYHFPYDWRRDNRASARILKKLLDKRLKCWRDRSGAPEAKVILLAHSMGGLVSRYYLEVLGGWRDAKALYTFGTPYRGSLNAVSFLANGYKKAFIDLTNVMRSLTAVYQLLPIYQAIQIDNDFVRITETNKIPNVNQARARDARKFHDEIYDANQQNLTEEDYRHHFTTVPVVGTRQPTLQSAKLVGDLLVPSHDLPAVLANRLDYSDGDGTVPKISAIPNELSNSFNNLFIAEAHGALQNQEQVLDSLKGAIATSQFTSAADIRDADSTIGLALDDIYLPDEAIALKAQVTSATPVEQLSATVTSIEGDAPPATIPFTQETEQDWSLTLDTLPAGLYRIAVSATGNEAARLPSTVHNSFAVVDKATLSG